MTRQQPRSTRRSSSPPTAEEVVKDLRAVVKAGLRDIAETPLPALRSLALVRHTAGSDDPIQIALAVETTIEQAVERIGEGYLGEVLQALFGLDSATRGLKPKQRRRVGADRARSTYATFDRHDEARLLRSLAIDILRQDADHRRRAERAGWADRPLTRKQQQSTWLERFGYYHAIQTTAVHLRHDVIAAVTALQGDYDDTSQADYLHGSLWWFARFLTAVERFDRSPLAGNWVLPDPDAEATVQSAVYQIRWHSPYNERGESLLRVTLADVTGEELWPWIHRLQDSPEGTEIMGMWEAWAAECTRDLETDDDTCGIHGMVDQTDRYREVIERQWQTVVGSYRELPPA